ncbi:MAG TPA: MaoC family dehydratase [Alphaproteobacteria bacterium]|nr:dehydratase [Rhodospirillaceae bacterium]HRJ67786.1 MaoC family dehydratase [Alphaproteobacteria bacterium]
MDNDVFTFMEDMHEGQIFESGPVTVTAEDIIAFASKYDPQDFHLDAEKAKDTAFGELVASGWHTASLTMSLIVAAMPKMKGGMIGRTIESLTWLRPVRPGDSLSYRGEVIGIRASGGDAKRGILRTKNTTFNQNGEPVMEMTCVIFVPRRP